MPPASSVQVNEYLCVVVTRQVLVSGSVRNGVHVRHGLGVLVPVLSAQGSGQQQQGGQQAQHNREEEVGLGVRVVSSPLKVLVCRRVDVATGLDNRGTVVHSRTTR